MLFRQKFLPKLYIPLLITLLLTPLTSSASELSGRLDHRGTEPPLQEKRSVVRGTLGSARFSSSEVIVKYAHNQRPIRLATRGRQVDEILSELAQDQTVEYAEPNYIAHAFFVPNDTYYQPYQWNFHNDTHGGIHAESAWDVSTGNGVVVAIIDTGVAYENYDKYRRASDLAGTNFVAGYDFVNNDTHPNDDEGHGTHIAGTIAGTTNNNSGVAGLAHSASIMPVKVLDKNGSGTYADVADGIRYAADHGADVINLSLGGPVGASYLEDAVRYAYGKGVTIVAAAGNDGANKVSYPAAYDDYVIAVGATRFDERVASYSNKGSALDLVAPGGDTKVDQNGDGYGDGILQQTFQNSPTSFGYYFYQGTSMAAPHVAAAAALVISNGKASTPAAVQELLQSTADDLGSAGRDNTYGHGLLNLAAALTSNAPTTDAKPEKTNEPPIAKAGSDYAVTDNDNDGSELVTLDGSASTDADGSIVAHEWFKGATALGHGKTLKTTLPVGVHTITLRVTDDQGATDDDTVTVTIAATEAEEIPAAQPTVLLSENFEKNWNGWTQDRQNDWQISARNAYAGKRSVEIDGPTTNGALFSPLMYAGGKTVRVGFAWFIDGSLDAGEYLAFDISTDGGRTWKEYRRLSAGQNMANVWFTHQIELANVSSLQLRFRGTISSAVEDAYLDAVTVETY